jgi:hypothetical protein
MSLGGPQTAGRETLCWGEVLMSLAAHVRVLCVCRNCLSWLARAKFFTINPGHTLFWQLRFLSHIFFTLINICRINSLFVMRAETVALSDWPKLKFINTAYLGLTLSEATKALRESKGTALLYFWPRHEKGWGVSVTTSPHLTPGKTRYPLYRRLGGPQGRSGQLRKISPPQGFDPRTVQSVGSTAYLKSTKFSNSLSGGFRFVES